MPTPEDLVIRDRVCRAYIAGEGLEIGAGASPSAHPGIQSVTFIDKRGRDELSAMFGAPISYDVETPECAIPLWKDRADFLIAHHVMEHLSNPIAVLLQWFSMLKLGGRAFISIPSNTNPFEQERIPVTFEHILLDYLLDRGEADFESKQHIPHFVLQWTARDESMFWYGKESAKNFSAILLGDLHRDGQDLHWHTYTMEVFRQTIEAAFWFAGRSCDVLHTEDAIGGLYIVAEAQAMATTPTFLQPVRARLQSALGMLQKPT